MWAMPLELGLSVLQVPLIYTLARVTNVATMALKQGIVLILVSLVGSKLVIIKIRTYKVLRITKFV